MSITVKILKRTAGGRPTLYATRDLDVLPVSIGRDAACTIALEDPNKHMSRFHVEIEEEGGTYWMSVVSKVNPVMVKGRRYGPGTRLTLHSGDSFELADYEVHVVLPEPAPAAAVEDDAERLFNESTFLGADQPQKKAEPPPEETFIPQTEKAAAPVPAAPPSHALRAFFEGAPAAKELSPMQADRMSRLRRDPARGGGHHDVVVARRDAQGIQAEERTMVAARDNNPLKLMSDPHEAMNFLFDPAERTDGFLDPVQSVGDACEDLRSHELALMAGMRAAILGALRHFDPHALERMLDKSPKGFSLASRKSKLWDVFVAQQDQLSREAQEDFNRVFGRDFMSAYQAQLRRLKGGR
jgi:predicted component of type VI protein secretion system